MKSEDTDIYKNALAWIVSNNIEHSEYKFGRIRLYLDNATIDYWPTRGTIRVKGEFKVNHIKDIKTLINAK